MSLRTTFNSASIRGWWAPAVTSPVVGGAVLYNQLTTDIQFSRSIKISHDGNYLIVGSTNGAWIYKRSTTGTELNYWTLQQQLPTPAGSVTFGYSVDINGDGTIAAVGDPAWNGNLGRLSTFSRSGTTWSSIANITATSSANSRFARQIAMGSSGTKIAATYDALTGYIHMCDTTSIQGSYLVGVTPRTISMDQSSVILNAMVNDPSGLKWYQINTYALVQIQSQTTTTLNGTAIATNTDGSYMAYGDGLGGQGGRVFIFNGSIATGTWNLQQTISFTFSFQAGFNSGFSLDINSAGDTLVIGTLENTNTWVDTNGNTQTGKNATTSTVYVYRRVGTVWTQSAVLSSNTGTVDGFGISVSISKTSGNYIAVGSPTANPASTQNVRIYRYNGTTWSNSTT